MSINADSPETVATPSKLGNVARLAAWTMRHRRIVLISWVVLLIGVSVAANAVGTRQATNFSLPGTDTQRALDLLQREFPAQAGDTDQIVFRATSGRVDAAGIRAQVSPMLRQVSKVPHVSSVISPFSPAGADAISKDGRIAFATVNFDQRANQLPTSAIDQVISLGQGARSSDLQVELGGQAIETAQQPSFGFTTAIGVLAAIVVLLITFGSLVAMGLPIVTALLGLGTGVGLIALGSQVLDMPDFATELAVMIGLGVGIDYSLFIVTRFRENYRAGAEPNAAVLAAMDTAGRAIVFAGCTVIIALLGMFALGVSFLYGVAVAASLAVLLTLLAALTVLPALLSRFGARIGREGRRARKRPPEAGTASTPTGFWFRWSGFIQRHPWPSAAVGLAIMLVLVAPVVTIRLGSSDAGNDPPSDDHAKGVRPARRGLRPRLQRPTAGGDHPPRSPAPRRRLARCRRRSAVIPASRPLRRRNCRPTGAPRSLLAYPTTAPQAAATTQLVNRLRDSTLPPVESATGTTVLIGGVTAGQIDFSHVLAGKLPLFIGIVVLLSALLLLIVFRSLVIPLQAALMNLLSIGASLGVIVASSSTAGWAACSAWSPARSTPSSR